MRFCANKKIFLLTDASKLQYLNFEYILVDRVPELLPSKTKFDLQERTIISLREDIEALELANEDLRKQLEEKKNNRRID